MGELFRAAAAGQPQAIAEIHRILRSFSRQVCRGAGPHGEPAMDWEDVAQQAAGRLFQLGLGQYRGKGSERSYLYSLVKTTVIQISRSARRRQRREAASVEDDPASGSHPQGAGLEVRRILAALDPDCREIIQRALLQDEPYADLARDLGLAESSVRARLSRCLRKARRLVDPEVEP